MFCPSCGKMPTQTRYFSKQDFILKATIENFLAECECSALFFIFARRVAGHIRSVFFIERSRENEIWESNK